MDKDLKYLEEQEIVFYSIDIVIPLKNDNTYIMHPQYPDRITKCPKGLPPFRNIKVTKKYDPIKNGSVIFLGEIYNLIGIDIDNKGNTINDYYTMIKDNNIEPTLTIKTCNNGYHEYYRLTIEQQNNLKTFTGVNGDDKNNNMFGLNIDIKYNNQVFIGPSVFGNKKEFKYKLHKAIEPIILPDILYKEIIKNCVSQQQKTIKNIFKQNKFTNKITKPNTTNLSDYGFVDEY